MTRASFGAGVADFAIAANAPGDPLRFASGLLTLWTAETGGAQITDLLLDGDPVIEIPVGTDGQIPTFQGPDGVVAMWAQLGGGPRVQIDAGAYIATLAQAAAAAAEVARLAAVEAQEAAEAVGATNEALMTGIDGNPASAFRVQSDARHNASYARLDDPLIYSLIFGG